MTDDPTVRCAQARLTGLQALAVVGDMVVALKILRPLAPSHVSHALRGLLAAVDELAGELRRAQPITMAITPEDSRR
ncbi:MAG: hypothetical protein Q7W02_02460 [Candidatus Rokubacteria bacterium]|nr:hypothetical protein [Candidatus Rokubacteria bacterium]